MEWNKWPTHEIVYETTEGSIRLSYRGKIPEKSRTYLSVVGTRKITDYGAQIVNYIVRPLARAGVIIVSGFMYGVDVIAHKATLEENGTTIAVLGSGLDFPCPANQGTVYTKILEKGGAVMSPFSLHDRAQRWMFPQRNKIVAVISQATLVIEAAEKSGSLITARYAEEYGKIVMAVPGSIFAPYCNGTNMLIRSGAVAVRTPTDVAEVLGVELPLLKNQTTEFGGGPFTVDELSRRLHKPVQEVLPLISQMMLEDQIYEQEGKYYAR